MMPLISVVQNLQETKLYHFEEAWSLCHPKENAFQELVAPIIMAMPRHAIKKHRDRTEPTPIP